MIALSLAQKNVTRKQERSFLTIVGVILAVGSFVALLSVAEGLHHKLYREVYGRNVDIYILPHSTVPLPTGPIGALGYTTDVIYLMQTMAPDKKAPRKSGAGEKTATPGASASPEAKEATAGPPAPGSAKTPDSKDSGEGTHDEKVQNILAWLNPSDENPDTNVKRAIGITRFQQNIKGKMVVIWGIPYDEIEEELTNSQGRTVNFMTAFFPSFQVIDGIFPIPAAPFDDPYCQGGVRALNSLADDEKRVIIGEKLAQELRLTVGGREIDIKRGKDTVKLSIDCIGRFNVGFQDYFCFIPIQTALSIEDSPGKVREIWVQVKDKRILGQTKKMIQDAFPDLAVKTSEEYLGASSELVKYAWLMQFAIALIGILIATTASMNTMLMSTFERIKEFGAMRAIGTSRLTIIMMVLIESLILSLTGGIFGIVIGLLGSRFLDGAVMALFKATFPIAHVTLNLVIYALLLSLFIGIIGAIIPAIIIYRMDIIRSLKWE